MKIIYNRFLPFPGYTAVNLFGVLFVRKEHKGKTGVKFRQMVTHETIHTKQMQEMGYIFFYIWYLVEWLIKCLWYFSPTKAYYAISFEREAYDKQWNAAYPSERKHFAWTKLLYVKNRKYSPIY